MTELYTILTIRTDDNYYYVINGGNAGNSIRVPIESNNFDHDCIIKYCSEIEITFCDADNDLQIIMIISDNYLPKINIDLGRNQTHYNF